jgi:hypothetical protein
VCALAALLAFGLLDDSKTLIAFILAFAAGAILAMLADRMMPEAFEYAGKVVALVTVLGFAVGFRLRALPLSLARLPLLGGDEERGTVAGPDTGSPRFTWMKSSLAAKLRRRWYILAG